MDPAASAPSVPAGPFAHVDNFIIEGLDKEKERKLLFKYEEELTLFVNSG